jgi:hypothetical protein
MHRIIGVVLVAASLLVLGVPDASAGSRGTTVTFDCLHVRVRPRAIVFACADGGFFVRGLRWGSWHRSRARARGSFHENDCTPDCARGDFHVRTGTLRLHGRLWCNAIDSYVFRRAIARFDAPLLGRDEQRFRLFCPL